MGIAKGCALAALAVAASGCAFDPAFGSVETTVFKCARRCQHRPAVARVDEPPFTLAEPAPQAERRPGWQPRLDPRDRPIRTAPRPLPPPALSLP